MRKREAKKRRSEGETFSPPLLIRIIEIAVRALLTYTYAPRRRIPVLGVRALDAAERIPPMGVGHVDRARPRACVRIPGAAAGQAVVPGEERVRIRERRCRGESGDIRRDIVEARGHL